MNWIQKKIRMMRKGRRGWQKIIVAIKSSYPVMDRNGKIEFAKDSRINSQCDPSVVLMNIWTIFSRQSRSSLSSVVLRIIHEKRCFFLSNFPCYSDTIICRIPTVLEDVPPSWILMMTATFVGLFLFKIPFLTRWWLPNVHSSSTRTCQSVQFLFHY